MKIGVIDAQGARLGSTFIKKAKKEIEHLHIIALGTNEAATANMIKAGAEQGIMGEKDICDFLDFADLNCIVGPIGMLCAGGIRGEITSKISQAVLRLECTKYIIPLQKHGIYIPGTRELQIKDILDEIIADIKLSTC